MTTTTSGTDRLRFAVLVSPINPTLGLIGDEAGENIAEFLDAARYADPLSFSGNAKSTLDTGLQLRKQARMLLALLPADSELGLAARLRAALGNEGLSTSDCLQIVRPRRSEEPAAASLQEAASLLRSGLAVPAVCKLTGLKRTVVYELSAWMGVGQARKEALVHQATEAARYGDTAAQFAVRAGIEVRAAASLLAEGRKVLVELGEVKA